MGVYPEAADPTETANVLYQAEAVQTNTETLAIIAATLANVGVCPLTQERCINAEVMKVRRGGAISSSVSPPSRRLHCCVCWHS